MKSATASFVSELSVRLDLKSKFQWVLQTITQQDAPSIQAMPLFGIHDIDRMLKAAAMRSLWSICQISPDFLEWAVDAMTEILVNADTISIPMLSWWAAVFMNMPCLGTPCSHRLLDIIASIVVKHTNSTSHTQSDFENFRVLHALYTLGLLSHSDSCVSMRDSKSLLQSFVAGLLSEDTKVLNGP